MAIYKQPSATWPAGDKFLRFSIRQYWLLPKQGEFSIKRQLREQIPGLWAGTNHIAGQDSASI